jgi:membrane-associated phospholipid phosphatase
MDCRRHSRGARLHDEFSERPRHDVCDYLSANRSYSGAKPNLIDHRSLYFMLIAAFLTMLIGASHIYLGVHYPTDVLAGWCIGAAWALGCWAASARFHGVGQLVPSGRP